MSSTKIITSYTFIREMDLNMYTDVGYPG